MSDPVRARATLGARAQPLLPASPHPAEDQGIALQYKSCSLLEDSRREAFLVSPSRDRHGALGGGWGRCPPLRPRGARFAARHFDAIIKGLALGVEPWERGQQRGVDVQHAAPVLGEKRPAREHPHEPRQADQVGSRRAAGVSSRSRSYSARSMPREGSDMAVSPKSALAPGPRLPERC